MNDMATPRLIKKKCGPADHIPKLAMNIERVLGDQGTDDNMSIITVYLLV